MAITYKELIFLKYCSKKKSFNNTLCLGNQNVAFGSRFKKILPNFNFNRNSTLLEILKNAFGTSTLETLDISNYEGASLIFDLNKKIDIDKKFDTTIDIGTSYFIYDVKTCFRNIIDITNIGGSIIHVLPSNNFCNLGFYQFSPDFFYELYSNKNGFMNTEVFVSNYSAVFFNSIYKLNLNNEKPRNLLPAKDELVIWVRTEKIKEVENLELYPLTYQTVNKESNISNTETTEKNILMRNKNTLYKVLKFFYYSLKIDFLKELIYELKIKFDNSKSLYNKKLFTKVDKRYFLD